MFVAAMTKLICCIFIFTLLILRINTTLEGWKKARINDGLSLFAISAKSSVFVLSSVIEHGFCNLLHGRLMTMNRTADEGILVSSFLSKKTSFSGLFNFNPVTAIMQVLEVRNVGLPVNRGEDTLLKANYVKYSSRHYLYNRTHILT
ncbi:hypothetical protein GGR06_001350 [Bacteroides reticulotermitis]|uniref:Uncharacterized protein n=1 Tax=Bacteroides reticulotermitis TaxID=1133319 RepID=A0A840CZL8_9BACE|nr:hypothetical protein [Bacteroides reticulotermitis]